MLAGDNGLLIDSLRLALNREKMRVSVTGGTDPAMVTKAAAEFEPDVVVVFEGDPDATVALIRAVIETGHSAVTLTKDLRAVDSARFVAAGAASVVGLDTRLSALVKVVELACAGKAALPLGHRYELEGILREHTQAEARRIAPLEELSPRERAIFALIYEGLGAEQIADEECIAVSTVRTHIRNILTKLQVHSQLAAVAMARSHRWFDSTGLNRK